MKGGRRWPGIVDGAMVPWKGSGRSFSSNLECGECWSILSRQGPLVELLRDAGGGTGCCQSITFPSVTSSPLARDSPIPSLLQPWCPAGFWCFSSRDLRTFLAKGTNPSSWDEENHSYLKALDGRDPEAREEKPSDMNRGSCQRMGKSWAPKMARVLLLFKCMRFQENFGNGSMILKENAM